MQRRVRVLLRVDDPHAPGRRARRTRSTSIAVRGLDGVEVGQVEQHEPVRARRRRRDGAAAPRASRAAGRRRRPTTAAVATDVVGRRRPAAASSAPASALKSEDLPGAGRARERDDRGLEPEAEPLARPRDARRRAARPPPASSRPSASSRRLGQRGQPACRARRLTARARTARARRAGARRASASRRDRRRAARSKRAASAREQLAHAVQQVLARPRGERAHRLVAEDRLEHPLADRRGAARDHDLRAGQPARAARTRRSSPSARRRYAERREPRRRALARALAAHELEHVALPGADLRRPCAPHQLGARRRRAPARRRAAPARPAASRQPRGARSAARSAAARTTASTPISHRGAAAPRRPPGLPVTQRCAAGRAAGRPATRARA